jgi:hypothetical protein
LTADSQRIDARVGKLISMVGVVSQKGVTGPGNTTTRDLPIREWLSNVQKTDPAKCVPDFVEASIPAHSIFDAMPRVWPFLMTEGLQVPEDHER